MTNMVIVGVVKPSLHSREEFLRVYWIDKKAVKDIKDADLAPVAEKLGVVNFADLQIPEVREFYPHYRTDRSSGYISGSDACYVLGTFGEGGYVCIRPHLNNDFIQVIPRSRLVSDVKKGTLFLLNALIEQGTVSDTIIPVTGEWEDMSHLTGRTLKDASDDTEVLSAGVVDKRDTIGAGDTVDTHDELGMLSNERKDFLKDYYIEYSVETFNKLVGKTSWRLKEDHEIVEKNQKRRATKLARLAELRTLSNGSNWRFAGLWDVGYVTGLPEHTCEFGHKLRYIYMACPVDKTIQEAKDEGTLLRFGIKCHADFLSIPAEEVSRLGKLLNTMSSEIGFISTVEANNAQAKHTHIMGSMHELLGRLSTNGKLTHILGERLSRAYEGFQDNGLPLVESFVLDVVTQLGTHKVKDVLSAAGVDTTLYANKPAEHYELPEMGENPSKWDKENYPRRLDYAHNSSLGRIGRAHDPYPEALMTYADMLLKNDIAGEYMYNPLSTLTDYVKGTNSSYQRYGADEIKAEIPQAQRKYLTGYNSDTRELRTRWLRYFNNNLYREDTVEAIQGYPVKALTLRGLEEATQLLTRITRTGENLKQAIGVELSEQILRDLVNTRLYKDDMEGYSDVHVVLLLTALPYIVTDAQSITARRMASYSLVREGAKVLSASLDATKEGTDPNYIQALLDKFTPSEDDVIAEVVKETSQEASKEELNKTAKEEPKAEEPKTTKTKKPEEPKTTKTKKPASKSTTNPHRGDPVESKKLADEFSTLYDELPKVLTADAKIQIAVDIINRFKNTFKEKEGFTSREKWRVENEIASLKRLKANKNK